MYDLAFFLKRSMVITLGSVVIPESQGAAIESLAESIAD
jgi:hypothetical protein